MRQKIQKVYDGICKVVMEPNGLLLGLLTEREVIDAIGSVVSDLLFDGAVIRKLQIQQIQFGKVQYEEPDWMLNTEQCLVDESHLWMESTYDTATANPDWLTSLPGRPSTYRMDQQEQKRISIQTAPAFSGPVVDLIQGEPFYGTLSEQQDGYSVSLVSNEPFYGVLSGDYDSPVYLEAQPTGLGTIENLVSSDGNLMTFGPSQPVRNDDQLNDFLAEVPNSFLIYIKYGALARIFTDNSELKDLNRAKYCQQRFEEGRRIMAAVNTDLLYSLTVMNSGKK
jgi:hypothetical protein